MNARHQSADTSSTLVARGGVWISGAAGAFLYFISDDRPVMVMGLSIVLISVVFESIRSEAVALAVIFICSGMAGAKFHLHGLVILPEHVALVVVTAGILYRSLKSPVDKISASISNFSIPTFLLIAWILLALVTSVGVSPDQVQSLRLVGWLTVSASAMPVVCLLRLNRHQVAIVLSACTLVYAAVSTTGWLLSQVNGSISVFTERDYSTGFLRAQGLMPEPNLAASYIVLSCAIIAPMASEVPKVLSISTLAISSTLVFLTFTRTAWLLMAFVIAVFLWRLRSPVTIAASGLVAIIGALVWPRMAPTLGFDRSFSQIFSTRANALVSLDSGTGLSRSITAQTAWAEISQTGWIFGRGLNSYPQTHFNYLASDGRDYLSLWWLQLVYDTGIPGFLIFSGAILSFLFCIGALGLPFVICLVIAATATNPFWFGYPWLLAGALVRIKMAASEARGA